MDMLLLNSIKLVWWAIGFMAGGFLLGYLIGYAWIRLCQWIASKLLGGDGLPDESSREAEERSREQGNVIQINFRPLPRAVNPWVEKKPYAKGA